MSDLRKFRTLSVLFLACVLALILAAPYASAQQLSGTVRGQVKDSTGASIPAADVTVSGGSGFSKTLSTDEQGVFSVTGLAPGKYTVKITHAGFATFESKPITVAAGKVQSLDVPMTLQISQQEVTVQAEAVGTVSVEASQNVGALVLKEADLEALPDDPDDLAADLQALAGPAAGPNGGQIFIDGFTGGQLPPKSSIREIRINQNPFSAEYDRLGFGRIEILTKPGTDKFRGQAFFSDSDGVFNARNPFTSVKPDYFSRQTGANFSGPLGKRASFFLDYERRDINDNAVVYGQLVDANFNIVPFNNAYITPQHRWEANPRIDYQLNANNTLVARYMFEGNRQDNAGLGGFSLASRAYNIRSGEQGPQITETAILGSKVVNETRFRYLFIHSDQLGDNSQPSINVATAFNGGGAQIGRSTNHQRRLEIQNYTSVSHGVHQFKFGIRERTDTVDSVSPSNFGGSFAFNGGFAGPQLDVNNNPIAGAPSIQISSIEQYRRTILFQSLGLPFAQIRALGGGPSQFSLNAGNPNASISQTDIGLFGQDDWRVRPNFTLSLGLRYETQTNIHDWRDIAPRLGFAWAPFATGGKTSKTVIRGGFGMFYDRFSETYSLDALRFNGLTEQRYQIRNPLFFGTIPDLSQLTQAPQTITEVDRNLRAPYIIQSAIGIERALPHNTTMAVTYTNSHATHLLRSRDINAPLPGSGLRPLGGSQDVYLYESTGVMNQNMIMVNGSTRLTSKIQLNAFYGYNRAFSDTDGVGTFPVNQYDTSREYGRAAIDSRHRAMIMGNIETKWGIRLNPFIIARSGGPFNITTGSDFLGDQIYNARPAFSTLPCNPAAGIYCTPYGEFNIYPGPNDKLIPRNYAQGPSNISVNLRVSRTWGFGPENRRPPAVGDMGGGDRGGRGPGGGGGGDRGGGRGGPGGGPGGGGGMAMGAGGMRGGFGGGGNTGRRYNLTLSASARNLLNTVNVNDPVGVLTSRLFGQSTQLASGGPGNTAAANRRLELQLRFTF